MYEVDFLPVESSTGTSGKSGDAIAIRFQTGAMVRPAVVVIDGGYSSIGDNLVDHVGDYYNTHVVDLVISTHPDADHINGLKRVLERLTVRELWVHNPRAHVAQAGYFSNIEAVDSLLEAAAGRAVPVVEPFEGLERFGSALRIVGPSKDYYTELAQQHVDEERGGGRAHSASPATLTKSLSARSQDYMPQETLDETGETGPRNNSSVITLISDGEDRLLFTGDAGVPALQRAADVYESTVGFFADKPMHLFQAPHHGSRRNLAPSILDRMLGSQHGPFGALVSVASSARSSEKHPNPKVVNALTRRGAGVLVTEGQKICVSEPGVQRVGWSSVQPLPPLDESD